VGKGGQVDPEQGGDHDHLQHHLTVVMDKSDQIYLEHCRNDYQF
jgi:hypothetical protein